MELQAVQDELVAAASSSAMDGAPHPSEAALSSSVSNIASLHPFNTIQSIPLKSPNSRAHKILTEVGVDD
jgi:hypothetical protein